MRRFLDTLVLLTACGLIVHAWVLHGWLFPAVVASSSMAPRLCGPHRLVTCRACRLRFACDSGDLSPDAVAVCPNCGAPDDTLGTLPDRPGDRLLIDRATWSWRAPARWDMAVFHDSADPATLLVKRIVGLPGETIELRAGDVYVNDSIACKSFSQLKRMAMLVHKDECRVRPNGSETVSRWQPENESTLWRLAEKGWTRAAGGGAAAEGSETALGGPDWLVYHHWQAHGGKPEPGPILDDYAYNSQESRQLNPVSDLLLRCRVRALGEGDLWLRIGGDHSPLTIRIASSTGQGEILDDADANRFFSVDPQRLAKGAVLELAFADGRFMLAVDGKIVFEHPCQPPWQPLDAPDRPLAIGAIGTAVFLSKLEVLRDVYYVPATGSGQPASPCYRLGPDQYFLLGDNSPVSVDSRQWQPAGVSGNVLMGRVLTVLAADRADK
jgi:signal peptidase I